LEALIRVLEEAKRGNLSVQIKDEDVPEGLKPVGRLINDLLGTLAQCLRVQEESLEHYRKILDTLQETYYEVDLGGHFTFFNKAFLRNLGYTEEELLGASFRKFMDEENASLVYHAFHQVYVTGEPNPGLSFTITRRNGTTFEVESSIALLRDDQGNPSGFYGVVRDITERRRLERERTGILERYQTVLDILDQAYLELDLHGNVTFVNDVACRFVHLAREQFIGKNYREFLPPDVAKKLEKAFKEIYRNGARMRYAEVSVTLAAGEERVFAIHAGLMNDDQGTPSGFQVLTTDMTEYRQAVAALEESERRYRMIVENMTDTIWLYDLDLKEGSLMSLGELPFTGYLPEELQAMSLDELVLPEDMARLRQVLNEECRRLAGDDLETATRIPRIEVQLRCKDGGTLWEEVALKLMPAANGAPRKVLVLGRNIDQRKKTEETQEKMERQLMQAQKMESVGRLAGGVAHDFNNVLTVILGSLDVLKVRVPHDDPAWELMREIEQAALRARDITKQLLAFSRRQIVKPVAVNLNHVIERLQRTLNRLIGEDVTIYYHLTADLWTVTIDPLQVEQILMNLVINARDALPSGGTITIETRNVTLDNEYCRDHLGFTPGSYALLSVSDNGTGIAPDILPYVFDPYFTTKGPDRGTGLGLATVYGIVKQNRGFVNVYSELGQGSTLRIYLPRSNMVAT